MDSLLTVLVIGKDEKSPLVETLFDFGYMPLLRRDMHDALYKLRHERFRAIFVDRSYEGIDALEFILNVRDINGDIPIILIGQPLDQHEEEILKKQPNLHLFENVHNGAEKKMQKIF
jgi:CheY-like chemotaxis protein